MYFFQKQSLNKMITSSQQLQTKETVDNQLIKSIDKIFVLSFLWLNT